MTSKNIHVLIFLGLILNQGNAQIKLSKNIDQSIVPHNLKVGEQVPNIFIPKILKDKYKSIHLKDIKEPLVILDFWAVGCSSCIAGLPKLDSIQNEFGNQIKILPVTYDLTPTVLNFYKNNSYGKTINLPTVVEDKYLTQWFKHWAISHEVWIYKGKVVAITDPSYVNRSNVKLILAGKTQNWPVKDDYNVIDIKKAFITNFKPGHNNYFTAISPYKMNVHADGSGGIGFLTDSINNTTKFYILNTAIVDAYRLIWISLGKPIYNISLEVKDKSKYEYDPKSGPYIEWIIKNGFCYESALPSSNKTKQERYQQSLEDLDNFFNLKTIRQNRNTKCTILFSTGEKDLNSLKTPKDEILKSSIVGNIHQFRHIFLDDLLHLFNLNILSNTKEINDTNYPYYIDIDLPEASLHNLDLARKELHKYGLDIKEESRFIDTFVIKEIN